MIDIQFQVTFQLVSFQFTQYLSEMWNIWYENWRWKSTYSLIIIDDIHQRSTAHICEFGIFQKNSTRNISITTPKPPHHSFSVSTSADKLVFFSFSSRVWIYTAKTNYVEHFQQIFFTPYTEHTHTHTECSVIENYTK